jgi:hypothetical protein
MQSEQELKSDSLDSLRQLFETVNNSLSNLETLHNPLIDSTIQAIRSEFEDEIWKVQCDLYGITDFVFKL